MRRLPVGKLLRPKLQDFDGPLIQGDYPARARRCLVSAELEAAVCKVDIAPLQSANRVVASAGFESQCNNIERFRPYSATT